MSGNRVQRIAHRWMLALLIVLLNVAPAWADDREAEARQAYEEGFAAAETNDFDLALSRYQDSYSLLARPRTMYNIAHCEEELGRGLDAIEHFDQFLRMATDREEDYRSLASSRMEALKRKFYGTLVIKSKPSRAEVFVDGGSQGAGRTPLQLRLPPGKHEVTVVAKNKRPVIRNITTTAGKKTTEFVSLGKATLNLVITPKEATVEFAEEIGVARKHLEESMEPGDYRFRISSPGYRTQTLDIRLKADTRLEQHVRLEPIANGALVVKSYRAGATVSVDGQVIGLTQHSAQHPTATVRASVAPGEHVLTIELGATTLRRRVHTARGEEVTVSMQPDRGSIAHSKGLIWTLAGVGAASVVVGGGLGLQALQRGSRSDPGEQDAARTQSLIGDLLVLGGSGALLGAWALKRRPGTSLDVSRSLLSSDEGESDAQ